MVENALHGMLDAHAPASALLTAIDEVEDAERAFDQRVRALFGVNNMDFAVLHFVDRVLRRGGSARVGDIADRFGVSSGSATEIVHRLTQAGLVHRVPHPTDARVRRLEPTESASARLAAVSEEARTDLDALVAAIPGEEQARLIALLGSVRDILRSSATR